MERVKHLEAVTVCVGYADFLEAVVPFNAGLFERWIIVTEPADKETREVCRRFNLECVLSDDGKRHGSGTSTNPPFNKGRLIERGLQHTSAEGWRLHIDADIALPYRFRQMLEISDLQEDMFYGIDRVMVCGYENWQKLIQSNYLQGGQYDYHYRMRFPKGCEIGTRWVHPQMGYVPIGFFQLWHSSQDEWKGIRVKPYPVHHGNACRTDVRQGLRWDRHKRAIIPEVIGVHLESEVSALGANWCGRTTKPFGPQKKK